MADDKSDAQLSRIGWFKSTATWVEDLATGDRGIIRLDLDLAGARAPAATTGKFVQYGSA
jgi:hypothetical protein